MYASEMAKYQIQDRVREADAFRTSKSARASKVAERHGRTRKVVRATVAALLWPIKH